MIANHKGEIPALILLLPFLAGITLGINFISIQNYHLALLSFFFVAILFISLNIAYTPFKIYKKRWLGGLLINIVIFIFGWLSVANYNELNQYSHFSKSPAQYLVVKVNNEPVYKNGLLRFTADVEEKVIDHQRKKVTGTLLIAIKDSVSKSFYYGDELLIPAKYNTIDPPFIPAEFNYKQYLANQNIYYQAFLYPKQYVLLKSGTGNPLIAYSLRLRQRLVEKLKVNMRDTDAVAVASTLILGYKADLSNNVLQAYSKTGTVHVLSVSGAHVAIIYILLTLVFGFLDRSSYGRIAKAVLIIMLIWFYSMLSGFSPAVCRAAVMISMVIAGKTFSQYINTLNILAISAFVLLIYDPLFIADVGFQLSYLAVFGLIAFQPMVYKLVQFKNKWMDKLWALCSVSIAAQVITFPLSAFYFHQFPVYFLLSNLFITVPSAIIMYSGILYLLLPQIPFLSKGIAFILEKTIILMNKGLAIIEHTPFSGIGKIWLTRPEYLLLYISIVALFYFLHEQKIWLLRLSLICLLLICCSISIKKIIFSRVDNVAFLNLKKHQGIVFKHGNAAVVITDLSAADKNFQFSIQPYLDSCLVTNIKLLTPEKNWKNDWFQKKLNYIQFMREKILIDDRDFIDKGIIGSKIDANYVYLLNEKAEQLPILHKRFNYNYLVVSTGFPEKKLTAIKAQADSLRINYKILRRNNSFITVSN